MTDFFMSKWPSEREGVEHVMFRESCEEAMVQS